VRADAWAHRPALLPGSAGARAQAAAAERREREEREAAARKRAGREAEESDKRRRRAAHADAAAAFRALLGEMVKDPDAAWSAWRPRLQRDPQARALCRAPAAARGAASVPSAGGRGAQGRASNPALDDRELTGLFREHVDAMHQRAVTAFTDLLDEVRPPGRSRRAGRARLRACGAHDLSRWRARPGLLARR